MFAVIFKATIKELDDEYLTTATKLRDLAFSKYGCKDFTSCAEGNEEIAISYWETREQILAWKNDPVHKSAQEIGQNKWYKTYQVEIVELLHKYESQK
jgi:heme-degrading monooxygenase HmoA